MNAEEYGWANPAPGTRLWRLRTYPETLSDEDARLVAQDLLAHIDALTAAVRDVEAAYDRVNGWHDTAYDEVTDAMYAVLAILRGEA